MKSQKKSRDYVSHVVKVLLFHPSVRRLFHASLLKLFPFVLLHLQDCDIQSPVCKVQGKVGFTVITKTVYDSKLVLKCCCLMKHVFLLVLGKV